MIELITLPVTSVLAGALILLLMVLSVLVTVRRATLGGIEFGDAEDVELRHRIHAHGNLVEIAPMVLIAVGLMENAGAPNTLLWIFAGVFFIGRVFHALRMYMRNRWLGLLPIVTQHLICLAAGAWLLNHFLL